MAINTHGYPLIAGADQEYYDELAKRVHDSVNGVAKAVNQQGTLGAFLGASDGTGGGVWPGVPQPPAPTGPPAPADQSGGPATPFHSGNNPNPAPVYGEHPDNSANDMGRVPTYAGPAQRTDDLFADLMAGVKNRGGGTTAPPPAEGGGNEPITLPGGGGTPPNQGPPGGGGGDGGETPNQPHGGGSGLGNFINDLGRDGVQIDDRRGGSYFQQPTTRDILNSQTPLEIDWGNLGSDAINWIKDKWQNWDTGDTVKFLAKLAAGAAVPGLGIALTVGEEVAQAAIDKLKAAGLDPEGNPLEGGDQQNRGSGGGESSREGGSGGSSGYGSGYSGGQTGLGDYGNMNPGGYYSDTGGASLPGMGGGGGGGYGGFLGGSWLSGGGGLLGEAPKKTT